MEAGLLAVTQEHPTRAFFLDYRASVVQDVDSQSCRSALPRIRTLTKWPIGSDRIAGRDESSPSTSWGSEARGSRRLQAWHCNRQGVELNIQAESMYHANKFPILHESERQLPSRPGPSSYPSSPRVPSVLPSLLSSCLAVQGYRVSGSDIEDSEQLARLRAQGATVIVGHSSDNISPEDLPGAVVVSSAVPEGNPEVEAARTRGVPMYASGGVKRQCFHVHVDSRIRDFKHAFWPATKRPGMMHA